MNLKCLLGCVVVIGLATGCASNRNHVTEKLLKGQRPVDAPVADVASIDKMLGEDMTEMCEFVDQGIRLPYRLHKPAILAKNTCYPLVLFLHDASERGTDNTKTLTHGIVPICRYAMKHGDAFVVAPQCPVDRRWVDRGSAVARMKRPNAPTEEINAVMTLLRKLKAMYPIDGSRIYVTGISMGGFGTWDIVPRMPGFFAAMMPICGGVDTDTAMLYKDGNGESNLGIRFFHGGDDTVVSPDYSRRMDEALTKAGIVHRYTEYPGIGHDCWTQTYENEENLFWLFNRYRRIWDVHVSATHGR